MIDLINLEKTKISTDLGGKYILLYGMPKVGKTTFSARIPGALLLAFEKGYQALPSVYAQDISKWSDFKQVIRQLQKNEVKEKYNTVIIDTANIAYDLCEKHICNQHGVESVSDIAWGKGYAETKQEFMYSLRQISMMGYGIVFISHSDFKVVEGEEDEPDIVTVRPNLNKRAYEVINAMVDLIAYIAVEYDENGSSNRFLYTRGNQNIVAGSRFEYLPSKIPFGYETLVNELAKAIKLSADKAGVEITDEEVTATIESKELDYFEIRDKAREIWEGRIKEGKEVDSIVNATEKIFGEKKRLSEISETETALFKLLLDEMEKIEKGA